MKDKFFFRLVQICFLSYIIFRPFNLKAKERTQEGSPVSSPLANGLSISEQLGEQKSPETPKSPLPCTDFDAAYFHSYAHVRIHEEMIKGIFFFVYPLVWLFSFLQVYAVDASDIAVRAEEVLKANGLSDKVIVLHGRVEIISSL
uniref:Uncharacterized protein n=1 Tax=Brassica oleracea TaxID=3712 RepID=A0A3P6FGE7_BRAOL|nr:unnamed protein product [Brassica oleracea]